MSTLPGTRYAVLFTSPMEMRDQFSERGVDLHLDDLFDSDDALTRVMEHATGEVLARLSAVFTTASLAASPYIRNICTIIACYWLSRRRANHPVYEDIYQEALMKLLELKEGLLSLPELVRGNTTAAVMQNVRSDNRTPFNPILVDTRTSSYVNGSENKGVHFFHLYGWYWM